MDGFAVRFEDTQEAPSTLDIIATSQAAAGTNNSLLQVDKRSES